MLSERLLWVQDNGLRLVPLCTFDCACPVELCPTFKYSVRLNKRVLLLCCYSGEANKSRPVFHFWGIVAIRGARRDRSSLSNLFGSLSCSFCENEFCGYRSGSLST